MNLDNNSIEALVARGCSALRWLSTKIFTIHCRVNLTGLPVPKQKQRQSKCFGDAKFSSRMATRSRRTEEPLFGPSKQRNLISCCLQMLLLEAWTFQKLNVLNNNDGRASQNCICSWICAYTANRGELKRIFMVKKLHLGHVAKAVVVRKLPYCNHSGLIEGLSVFESMRVNYRIEPRMEHYATGVYLLGCAERCL